MMDSTLDLTHVSAVIDHWRQTAHEHRELIAALVQGDTTRLDTIAAAIMWSILVEPGDRDAWTLIERNGYVGGMTALQQYAHGLSPRERQVGKGLGESSSWHDALARWSPRFTRDRFGQVIRSAASLGISVLLPDASWWPRGLSRLGEHAPIILWCIGRPEALESPTVAYVGARAATAYGEYAVTDFITSTASDGLNVVSGGAYGIDGAAHRAALRANVPTIAVLAGGLDRLYPRGHVRMLTAIAEAGGALIAEVPPATAPTRWRFLARNRVIASLAEAVVVVEAGFRSGALNTAHHAMELGVPVGAVPGAVTSSQSAGCHRLFKEGLAACITSGADVLELAGIAAMREHTQQQALSDEARRVYDAVQTNRILTDEELAVRSGCALADTAMALGQLELADLVSRDSNGWRKK